MDESTSRVATRTEIEEYWRILTGGLGIDPSRFDDYLVGTCTYLGLMYCILSHPGRPMYDVLGAARSAAA